MKWFLNFVMIIILLVLTLFAIRYYLNQKSGLGSSHGVLAIYNWGDYIDPDLIKEFEQESGYSVIYETFDSNEAMLTKVKANSSAYDIVVPSEYMISKMIDENLLKEIDYSKIKGMENLDPRLLNQDFDKNNRFSIPYFFGTVGIAYNSKKLDEANIKYPTSYNDLWSQDYENNILLVDGAREVVGMALNSLGYSLNTKSDSQLNLANEKLLDIKKNVRAIVGDEIKLLMQTNEAYAAVVWSGDAQEMMTYNEDIEYVIPSEGSNVWLDSLVIPKTSSNEAGAYEFINFMLEAENAQKNAEYVEYATPNLKAQLLMDQEVVNDERFYPENQIFEKLEFYENLGYEYLQRYNQIFLDFKMIN